MIKIDRASFSFCHLSFRLKVPRADVDVVNRISDDREEEIRCEMKIFRNLRHGAAVRLFEK